MLPESLPRLKAPREHGQLLVHPPVDTIATLLARNRAARAQPVELLGRSLSELRRRARAETLAAARDYLELAGEPVPAWSAPTWLVAGHQPEPFHPGVWAKNFALQALARKHDAVPLNVIVDDDTAKHTHVAVPAGNHTVKVAYDRWQSEVPFEERAVLDEGLYASFPERVNEVSRAWPFRPWLDGLQEAWRAQAAATPLLGERIVRLRRELERQLGIEPLEVPLSALCRTEAFAWFACTLLADLPRLHASYNSAVAGYRHRHGLRSRNHPVPDLVSRGERWETPFWVWHRGGQRRHRLFAAKGAEGLALLAGDQPVTQLRGPPTAWTEAWRGLESAGLKIRSRALTTTLFCRLLLADLFVHGIGGGKYDEVTDALIHAFFGVKPPAYLVVTATALLPLPRFPDARTRFRGLQAQQRDLWYNPQRHLDTAAPKALSAQAQKTAALGLSQASHVDRVRRFHALQDATAALRPFVDASLEDIGRSLVVAEDQVRRHQVALERDYSFLLYPEDLLRTFFADIQQRAFSG